MPVVKYLFRDTMSEKILEIDFREVRETKFGDWGECSKVFDIPDRDAT